jgi:hypothetical protein
MRADDGPPDDRSWPDGTLSLPTRRRLGALAPRPVARGQNTTLLLTFANGSFAGPPNLVTG